jgi:putative ABC transport system substrate-binding protein
MAETTRRPPRHRRGLIALAALLVLAASLKAAAQPAPTVRRIGLLSNGTATTTSPQLNAFRRGLHERGWVEGQTVAIEYRWAEGNADRIPTLFADLVRARVDVIVLSGSPALRTARAATTTIPVAFLLLADPVSAGFVSSLARPGGNMTGVASEFEELITKQLQLLREALPRASRVALLYQAQIVTGVLPAAEAAAAKLGFTTRALKVADASELETVVRSARGEGVLLVFPSPFFNTHRHQLIELAARYRLPAIYEFKNYVDDGGLMSYGPSINEMYRELAGYVDLILKGAKPGELPIRRPTTFELAINLKAAAALGLTLPPSLRARADHVIQ